MTRFLDSISKVLYQATSLLLTKHPTRTSLGVVLGVVVHMLLSLFSPTLATGRGVDFSKIRAWHCVGVGILLMHTPTAWALFRHASALPEGVQEAIAAIEAAGFSESEKRMQYRLLIQHVVDRIALAPDEARESQKILATLERQK